MTDAYTITCCSTADMPASYMEEHAIPYACFHFRLNGKEYADDLGASIPFEEFYRQIDEGAMPRFAVTMGVGTIMTAKKIVLIATGESKQNAVCAMVRGEVTPRCPASILQQHPDAVIFADRAAAAKLL